MLQPPLLIAMKAPQLWTNVKNGHTGQVGGSVGRVSFFSSLGLCHDLERPLRDTPG